MRKGQKRTQYEPTGIDVAEFPNGPAIYAIRCKRNARIWVGSSANVRRRIYMQFYLLLRQIHPCPDLQADFDRYGRNVFAAEILEPLSPGLAKAVLLAHEQYWIDETQAYGKGYNRSGTAQFVRYGPLPEATKIKMSVAGRGRPKTLEHRQKIGASQKGKTIRPENIELARQQAYRRRRVKGKWID